MRKWLIGTTMLALLSTCTFGPFVALGNNNNNHNNHDRYKQGPEHKYNNPGPKNRSQQEAQSVLRRTATVLQDAQQAANRRHYSSGLGRAVAHQRYARELYWNGNYQDAIFHSLRARRMAIQVIEGNRESVRWGFTWDNTEQGYYHQSPRDEELDRRIHQGRDYHDNDVLHIFLDIDL